MVASADIPRFWSWLSAESERLRAAMLSGGAEVDPTVEIDGALKDCELELAYDLAVIGDQAELTFTPEGDRERAAFVDEVVSAAPAIAGWEFHSRRQRKPLPVAIGFVQEEHGVDLSDTRVLAVSKDGLYKITFIDPVLASRPEAERYGVAATFLDHALGEAVAMQRIVAVDFEPGPGGIEMALVINNIIVETGPEAGAPTVLPR